LVSSWLSRCNIFLTKDCNSSCSMHPPFFMQRRSTCNSRYSNATGPKSTRRPPLTFVRPTPTPLPRLQVSPPPAAGGSKLSNNH
jgi:hypothetical protein